MFNVRLACYHLYGKWLFTWLSLFPTYSLGREDRLEKERAKSDERDKIREDKLKELELESENRKSF